jgi:hypothetical protein
MAQTITYMSTHWSISANLKIAYIPSDMSSATHVYILGKYQPEI